MSRTKWFWGAGVGLLLAGIGLQCIPPPSDVQRKPAQALGELLPQQIAGARVHDEPIASTVEMQKAVGELLNYNEGVFRVYQFPDKTISVYIAWWAPGRMSPRLVAAHVPDVCWPGNGWQKEKMSQTMTGEVEEMLIHEGLAPAEVRIFTLRAHSEYMAYWHKVGGDYLSYRTGFAPPWWAVFEELGRNGLNLRKEQLFVRISSDVPLTQFWLSDEFAPLRAALHQLGLTENRLTESH